MVKLIPANNDTGRHNFYWDHEQDYHVYERAARARLGGSPPLLSLSNPGGVFGKSRSERLAYDMAIETAKALDKARRDLLQEIHRVEARDIFGFRMNVTDDRPYLVERWVNGAKDAGDNKILFDLK